MGGLFDLPGVCSGRGGKHFRSPPKIDALEVNDTCKIITGIRPLGD